MNLYGKGGIVKKFILSTAVLLPLCLAWADWELLQYQMTDNAFMEVSVLNNETAWLCGVQDNVGGVVWKTTDSGNTWTGNGVQIGNMMWAHGLQFLNADFGVVSGYYINVILPYGCIYYTTNGGTSWSEASISGSTFLKLFSYLHFPDEEHGWVIATGPKIFKTTDGGINWFEQASLDTTYPLRNIFFLDTLTGWVVGGTTDTITNIAEQGVIAKTTDGGNTWTTQMENYPLEIEAVYFTTPDNGWAVGYKDPDSPGYFLHTTDGGTTWSEIPGPAATNGNYGLYDIKFLSDQEAWAVGGGDLTGWQNNHFAIFLHTTDNGQTWEAEEIYPGSLPGALPIAFDMYGTSFGIAGGSHLSIFRYPAGGPYVAEHRSLKKDFFFVSPNPFRDKTSIVLNPTKKELTTPGSMSDAPCISIYDALGKAVKQFNNVTVNKIIWDGTDDSGKRLSAGTYFISFTTQHENIIKKVVLLD